MGDSASFPGQPEDTISNLVRMYISRSLPIFISHEHVKIRYRKLKTATEFLGLYTVPVDEIIRECQLSQKFVITILLEAELARQSERDP